MPRIWCMLIYVKIMAVIMPFCGDTVYWIECDVFVQDIQENFIRSLAAGGLQVDLLKTNVNFSTVGPYYLGVNLTELTVSVVILVTFTQFLTVPCTTFLSAIR